MQGRAWPIRSAIILLSSDSESDSMSGSTDGTLTLRGLSAQARARLKRQAARERTSVNALLVRLIETQTAGVPAASKAVTAHDDLDALAGTWSARDAKAFERATAPFAEIDRTLWK